MLNSLACTVASSSSLIHRTAPVIVSEADLPKTREPENRVKAPLFISSSLLTKQSRFSKAPREGRKSQSEQRGSGQGREGLAPDNVLRGELWPPQILLCGPRPIPRSKFGTKNHRLCEQIPVLSGRQAMYVSSWCFTKLPCKPWKPHQQWMAQSLAEAQAGSETRVFLGHPAGSLLTASRVL